MIKSFFPSYPIQGAVGALEEYLAICESSDLDVADQDGRTPLHLACIGGHGEIVDIFLNRGGMICVGLSLLPVNPLRERDNLK